MNHPKAPPSPHANLVCQDIDICGAFALGTFSATCQGNCLDLVRTPTNYDNAWFEIKFVKVFTESVSLDNHCTNMLKASTLQELVWWISHPSHSDLYRQFRRRGHQFPDARWRCGRNICFCDVEQRGCSLVNSHCRDCSCILDDLDLDTDNPYTCHDFNWPVVLLSICMLDAHTALIDGHSGHLIYTFTGAAPDRPWQQYSLRSDSLWRNARTPVVQ